MVRWDTKMSQTRFMCSCSKGRTEVLIHDSPNWGAYTTDHYTNSFQILAHLWKSGLRVTVGGDLLAFCATMPPTIWMPQLKWQGQAQLQPWTLLEYIDLPGSSVATCSERSICAHICINCTVIVIVPASISAWLAMLNSKNVDTQTCFNSMVWRQWEGGLCWD